MKRKDTIEKMAAAIFYPDIDCEIRRRELMSYESEEDNILARKQAEAAFDVFLGELKEIPSQALDKYPDGSELVQKDVNTTFEYYQELINMKKGGII